RLFAVQVLLAHRDAAGGLPDNVQPAADPRTGEVRAVVVGAWHAMAFDVDDSRRWTWRVGDVEDLLGAVRDLRGRGELPNPALAALHGGLTVERAGELLADLAGRIDPNEALRRWLARGVPA